MGQFRRVSDTSDLRLGSKTIALILVLAVALIVALQSEMRGWLLTAITIMQDLGAIGVVAFAFMYIVATVAALPASLLTIAAGVLYGPYLGGVLVLAASLSAAVTAFVLARSWFRPRIVQRYGEGKAFQKIAAKTETHGAKLVFLLRLSPVVPFAILNYILGLTNVSLRSYALASAIGMVPGILLYTHVGSSLGSLSDVGGGFSVSGGWIFGTGLGATLLVTVLLGRWSAQALRDTEKTSQ